MLVHHEEAAVDDFLAWCLSNRVNWLRVFCSGANMFKLHPDQGYYGVGMLAERTRGTGLYIEAVAIADSFAYPEMDWAGHVRAIGELAMEDQHLTVELCNEPMQKWQPFAPWKLAELSQQIPLGVALTLGAADGPQDESRQYCLSETWYQNVHCDRTRSPWGNIRHVREQQVLSEDIGQYVINSEPMNAKDLTEAQCFGLGVLERVCQIGGVHHSDWGKACRLPTDDEQQLFDARTRGWDSVPETFWGTFANYKWRPPLPENPVTKFAFNDADARCYATVEGDDAYVVALNGRLEDIAEDWLVADQVDAIGDASVWHCWR